MTGTTQGSRLRVAGLTAILLLLAAAGARAQIAPGPLSRAHSSLNGLTQCTSCHKAGQKGEFACLECHKEVAARVAAQRGFHGSSLSRNASSHDCLRCHTEHKGENWSLVRWEPSQEGFDHRKTGYTLEGKHATLACSKCHNPEHIAAGERGEIQIKDLRRTFWGLQRQCLNCHEDKHAAQLGRECQRCHSFDDFKKPALFDHEKTKFARTGLHLQVTCQKCHQPRPDGKPQYAGLTFGQCADCHKDLHRGAFRNPCQSCHETGGWRKANLGDRFDHQKTKYPRLGKHAGVDCLKCHGGGDFKKPLPFKKCTDCHKPDPHTGQFAKRADGGECSACHTVEGFKPVRFALKEHAATAYPLEGKHAALACAKCHLPAGRGTIYRLSFNECSKCHKDLHREQFAAPPHRNRCEDCHTPQGFSPSLFTVAKHESSRFPLTGGHVKVECQKCHKPDAIQKLPGSFRFEDRSCATCHEDPHRGHFRQIVTRVRNDGSVMGCQVCHSQLAWKEVRFDHTGVEFPLVGKHRGTGCIKCHKPPSATTPLKEVDFKLAPKQCENCHQESHLGQFARADGSSPCGECHNPGRWKPAAFDHSRTAFPLPGRHKTAPCAGCHKNVKMVDGKPVIIFKNTPQDCNSAGCHKHPV